MNTAQSEKEEYPVYLDNHRNWHPRQTQADDWEPDFYRFSGKVFFLKDGRIGMEYAGRVIVRSIETWMTSIEFRIEKRPKPELYLDDEGQETQL